MMSRVAILAGALLAVAACRTPMSDDGGGDDFLPPGGDSCGGFCSSGFECTRTGDCLPPSQIRAIHLQWTIQGQPASEDTCAPAPLFYVNFFSSFTGEQVGFAPVPCKEGKFTIDKFNTDYDNSEIGINDGGTLAQLPIDANGTSLFDLDL